jgi:hypothetical protein
VPDIDEPRALTDYVSLFNELTAGPAFPNPFDEPGPEPAPPPDEWVPVWCGCTAEREGRPCSGARLLRERGNAPCAWYNHRTNRLVDQRPEGVPAYEPPPPPPAPPPLMILDAAGNEHELRQGILVISEGCDDEGFAGRVGRISRADVDGYDEVRVIVAEESWSFNQRDLRFLSAEPKGETKEPHLHERRQRLLGNLRRARARCEGESYEDFSAIRRLMDIITEGEKGSFWFWRTVAESFDDPRKVSFAPEPVFVDNDARRRFCSIKKLMQWANTKGLSSFTDDEIARCSRLVGNHFPADYNYSFEVVEGDAVVDGYRYGDYWGSCMQAKPHLVRFYAKTPDKCKLVKITQGGSYIGRAMMWITDQGDVVVDRVYPSDNGPQTVALHRWCEENGYDYKTVQGCCDGCLKSKRMDYTVTMKAAANGSYPYIDTFKYTDDDPDDSDTLTLGMTHCEYTFNRTEGGYEGGRSRCSCNECGDGIDEDEAEYVDDYTYCSQCYSENFIHLDYQISGRWVEETVHRDDACRCSNCDNWRADRHIEDLDNGDPICAVCIADAEATNCEECGNLFLSGDLNCSEEDDGGDGEYRCADCHATHVKEREEEAEAEEEQEEGGAIIATPAPVEPVSVPPQMLTMAEYLRREALPSDWLPLSSQCPCYTCTRYYRLVACGQVERVESVHESRERERQEAAARIDRVAITA